MADTNIQDIDLWNEPLWLRGTQFLGRILIWVLVWWVISWVVFALLMFTWNMFGSWLANSGSPEAANPIMAIIFLVIGFVSVFLWSVCIAWAYSMFFWEIYYDFGMMISKSLAINLAVFFMFTPLYLMAMKNPSLLIWVLAFHIAFSVFITQNVIEFVWTINYSASHLIWNTLWLTSVILVFWVLYVVFSTQTITTEDWTVSTNNLLPILIALPPFLSYTLMPMMHWIWSALYYKIYEWGSNFMYIPSVNEVVVDSEEVEEVNIDVK